MPTPTSATNTSQLQNQFAKQQSQSQNNLSTNTSGLQSRDPYSGSLPYLNNIMAGGEDLYGQKAPQNNLIFNLCFGQQVDAANNIQPATLQAWRNALTVSPGDNTRL